MKLRYSTFANPILILSDDPASTTGLGRIARDLATVLSTMPAFRVGFLARGGVGKRGFPWTQYCYPTYAQWGEDYIENAWRDFAGAKHGVIFSNWDPSRLLWFSQPDTLASQYPHLAKFLGDGRSYAKWGYFPVDGVGPNGQTLSTGPNTAVMGFDRVVAASEWGKQVLVQGGRTDADWLPHGYFKEAFHIERAPVVPNWNKQDTVIGCVMANQSRKDWPVAFGTIAGLKQTYGNNLKFWAHSDTLDNYWNLRALAFDYGVGDCTEITMNLTDEELRHRYSACVCTILPSAGEGFGYPILESLACGTPCVVTGYAAGQSLVPESMRVKPITYRVDTIHNVQRAVLSSYLFVNKVIEQVDRKRTNPDYPDMLAESVSHLEWGKLAELWKRWFKEGLEQ